MKKSIICIAISAVFFLAAIGGMIDIGGDAPIMFACLLISVSALLPILIPHIIAEKKLKDEIARLQSELSSADATIKRLTVTPRIEITVPAPDNKPGTIEFASDYVIIDVETTGVSPSDRIVQFAALRVQGDRVVDSLDLLINPLIPIPTNATEIHHITDQDVAGCPRFSEACSQIVDFVGSFPLLGHNISFDVRMINSELERCGKPNLSNPTIDTLAIARKVLHLSSYKLSAVCEHFGIISDNAHNALCDCTAAFVCYQRLKPLALLASDAPPIIDIPEWEQWKNEHKKSKQRQRQARALSCEIVSVNRDAMQCQFCGSSGDTYDTSLTGCTCPDFSEYQKPCKHMYRLAAELNLIKNRED